MFWSLLVLLVAGIQTPGVSAQKVGLRSALGFSCFNCALRWNFSCPNELLPYDCRCANDDFLTTALNCVNVYAPGMDEINWGYDYIRSQCHYWGNRTMSNTQLERIYRTNVGRLVQPGDLNTTDSVPAPVAVDGQLFSKQFAAANDTKYHYNIGKYFGCAIVAYWCLVILLSVVTNIIRIMKPNLYECFGAEELVVKIRKYVTLPALVGVHHNTPWNLFGLYRLHTPTRGQALIILAFNALNIASIVSLLGFGDDNKAFSFITKQDRVMHYLANRTGIIAFSHIPILVLFACRNNPFIALTGWPYDTFMLFHRWVARWMATHAAIHGVMLTWSSYNEKVLLFKWNHVHNWRAGNLAAYILFFMLVMAMRAVRRRIYELFVTFHQIFFVIFMVCLIVHCSDYGWLGWLWASITIYGLEYVLRLTRVIYSGGLCEAEFTLKEGGMYRVKVHGLRKWDVYCGAYIYLRIWDRHLFWQSHPFTVFQSYSGRVNDTLDLVCKAQKGATRDIIERLADEPGKRKVFRVFVEGPYGYGNYVKDYDSILLIAGGVGMTAMYSYASHVMDRLKPGHKLSLIWVIRSTTALNAFSEEIEHLRYNLHLCDFRIYLTQPGYNSQSAPETTEDDTITAERTRPKSFLYSHQAARPTQPNFFESLPNLQDTSFQLRHASTPESATRAEDEKKTHNVDVLSGTTAPESASLENILFHERPMLEKDVDNFIESCDGTKAVCSCGPPSFVDSVRDGIVQAIDKSNGRVDYFEDAFSW